MWQAFPDWTNRKGGEFEKEAIAKTKIAVKIEVCKCAVNNRKGVPESVKVLESEMKELMVMFNAFREESSSKSQLFAFWNEYVNMVLLLLREHVTGPYILLPHLR